MYSKVVLVRNVVIYTGVLCVAYTRVDTYTSKKTVTHVILVNT